MSELQAVEVENKAIEHVETETDAGTATATGEHQEEKTESPEEKVVKLESVVKEKAFKEREARRETEQLQAQIAELQANQPTEARPDIPAIPDPFDDDYEAKVRARDEAITKAVAFDTRQQDLQQQAQVAEQQKLQVEQETLSKRITTYAERATKLGVEKDELALAGQQVQNYGISNEIIGFILDNDKGPLITKYLSTNPIELETLRSMNPMQAAVYVETSVKAKAEALGGKKQSNAPDPAEVLNGAGAPAKVEGPAGATYE